MLKVRYISLWMVVIIGSGAAAQGSLLFEASLRGGDYGMGQTQDTMASNHGGSPHVLGITDSADGVTFAATESDGRSNAVIYFQPSDRTSYRTHGTISLWLKADSATLRTGELLGENYGWNAFRNGQTTFAASLGTVAGDSSQFYTHLSTWHSNVWYRDMPKVYAPTDQWVNIGYTWGGPNHMYEIWVNGELESWYDIPGRSLPWGMYSSATNIGLGGMHERGYGAYGSVAGVTMRDMRIWDEYRPLGDTVVPESAGLALCMLLGVLMRRKRR